jgi:GTP-binding protein
MVGKSNVGKSSLINAVVGRKKVARVSQTPGKTQAIQFYLINERFYIVDLPGYGYAKVSKALIQSWGELIRAYLGADEALRMIFLLLDVRRVPNEQDLQMHDWSRAAGIDERILLTKTDKLSRNQLSRSHVEIARKLQLDPEQLIACSIVTKQGIDQVRREIASRL